MTKFTLLTDKQYNENSNKLTILEKRGIIAPITDFSILLGGCVSNDHYYNDNISLENRVGWYWVNDSDIKKEACVVCDDGFKSYYHSNYTRHVGCRPVLSYSSIDRPSLNKIRKEDGILEVEYGEYPQQAASKNLQKELETAYQNNLSLLIKKTGKTYTIDSRKNDEYDQIFAAQTLEEYAFDNKKYVRVKANSYYGYKQFTLSNEQNYQNEDYIWIEVQPVKWLVDENADIALSEKILFAGVQFKCQKYYKNNFEITSIQDFLDIHFYHDIQQTITLTNDYDVIYNRKNKIEKLNPDTTNPVLRPKMTDTEIIKNWIENGQSVLLRGPSGIGKTERIKKLYPNLIYRKINNDESINNFNTFIDKIFQDFSRSGSEKHIIMLDELLDVDNEIQTLVCTSILNTIETYKDHEIPTNFVFVGTGKYKQQTNNLEETSILLEKLFDHILDMKPKVGEWVSEYAIPNKVHPAVIGYILTKYTNNNKDKTTNIDYFYEDHATKNEQKVNSPRKWVSVSNTLYDFEENLIKGNFKGENVENMLYVSLNSKLDEKWAKELFYFYNIPTLSIKEVMENNYSQADLPTKNEQFAYVTALLLANEEEVKECRKFIKEYCDTDYLQFYDMCWVGKDKNRMEKIKEIKTKEIFGEELSITNNKIIKKRQKNF